MSLSYDYFITDKDIADGAEITAAYKGVKEVPNSDQPNYLCNPSFCNGHPTSPPANPVEAIISTSISNSQLGNHYMSCSRVDVNPNIMEIVRSLANVLSNPNILAKENKIQLQGFKSKMGSELLETFERIGSEASGVGFLAHYHLKDNNSIVLGELNNKVDLQDKNWRDHQKGTFFRSITGQIIKLLKEVLPRTTFGRWFEYFFTNVSATRTMQFASVISEVSRLKNDVDFEKGLPNHKDTSPTYFDKTIELWFKTGVEGDLPIYLDTDLLKKQATKLATKQKYSAAIKAYEAVTLLRLADSSSTLHSLTACARIRLILAEKDPRQIPMLIFDYTRALEIDGNNVEVLYLRGKGLAQSERWDQAILDFEKVLKIDPLSAASADLIIAREKLNHAGT